MEQQTGMPVATPSSNKKIWITLAVILVALGGLFAYLRLRSDNPNTILPGDQNSLVVADQDPDAVAVLIADAQLRVPGFIAIHQDVNNAPGSILASSALLSPGDHKNVSIIMSMQPGAYYWAMLHGDDGNSTFSASTDQPLTNNAGNVVMVRFMVRLASPGGEQKG